MSSIFLFNEHLNDSSRWATRSISVSGPSGTDTGALPVTNVFTKNPAQYYQRTGITGGDTITLDLSLANASTPVPLLGNYAAAWGFLNCHSVLESTGSLFDTTIRVRESATAFTGPYTVDQSRTVYLSNLQNAASRQTFMVRSGINSFPAMRSTQFAQQGGNETQAYVRIEISSTAGGTWTLRIGRIVRMTGLMCIVGVNPVRGSGDDSEVSYSFSSYPYVLRKSPVRNYNGAILGLTDRQVYGIFQTEDGTNFFNPSINTIARVTGKSGEVCVIERDSSPAASSIWQNQPVFGLLAEGLVAERTDTTKEGTDSISRVDFSIKEIPQF